MMVDVGALAHPTLFTDHLNCLTATAGLPATTVFDGMLLLTTDPAATTAFSPMLTPFKMIAFIPIQTLSAIFTGAVFSFGRFGRSAFATLGTPRRRRPARDVCRVLLRSEGRCREKSLPSGSPAPVTLNQDGHLSGPRPVCRSRRRCEARE